MYVIAIDCRMLHCSGIGTFLRGVLKELIQHKDISFVLIGNKNDLSAYSQQNTKIIACNTPIFSIKELIGLPVKEINKSDCFFTPNYNIPWGIRVPIFSTIHDVLFLDFPKLTSVVGKIFRKFAIDRAIDLSTHIYTVSEFSRSRILHHSATAKTIKVCYNGAENVKIVNNKPDKINSLGEYYIYIGNIKPHKGLGTLLDAFEQPEVQNTGRKLVILGNQEAFKTSDKTISKRIAELSGSSKVVFTGYVDDISLIELLQNAYCLVQPSEYEGFGLPPLEAMQLGTPVIISDIPVFMELYKDFPVKYFKTSDVKSLAHAMLTPLSRIKLDDALKYRYTYKKTANIILSDIKSYLDGYENSSVR